MLELRRHVWWLLAGTLAIAVVLRLGAVWAISHQPISDELAYLAMSQSMLKGQPIADNMGNRAMYNVGYPMFVLAPVQWLFGDGLLAIKLANGLLSCTAVFLCFALAREAGGGAFASLTAAVFWAIYLPASVYSTYVLKEALMAPLMLGAVWCCLRVLKSPSVAVAITAGLLFGLLALVGNAALSLLAVAGIALVLTPTGWSGRLQLLLLGALTMAVIAVPWMYRNYQLLGSPVLNTNGGFNLYLGNNPAATGMFVSIKDTPMGAAWPHLLAIDEVAASRTLRQEALSWIRDHPSDFASLAVKKALLFWMPPTHSGEGNVSQVERIVRMIWLGQFIVIGSLALLSVLFRRMWSRELLLLWAAIALYTAVHMVFYVIFRYREPIMPLLCVIAALTVEQVRIRLLSSSLRR